MNSKLCLLEFEIVNKLYGIEAIEEIELDELEENLTDFDEEDDYF